MSDIHTCVQVVLPTADPIHEELLEEALWTVAEGGLERHDDETWSALIEDPRPRAPGSVRWRLYGRAPFGEHIVRDATARLTMPFEISSYELDTEPLMNAWREHFKPAQVSDRIWVRPPWQEAPAAADAIVIEIQPGAAFGTGTHETTRLCLRFMDEHRSLIEGARVLDVGCGSAILAVGASKLGAATVVAVDNDPDAMPNAEENIERNGVGDVALSTTPIADVPGLFDVVIANILPHILNAMRDELWAHVQPEGTLVLSGILATQEDDMRASFEGPEGTHEATFTDGEWIMMQFRRAASERSK